MDLEVAKREDRLEFIDKRNTVHNLIRLVEEAKQQVWLVSPYISLEKLRDLTRAIKSALNRNVKVLLVVRSADSGARVTPACVEAVQELVDAGMHLFAVRDLHAKIYISEKHALVTSLNLLDSSFNNSIEIGMWVPTARAEVGQIREFFEKEIRQHMQRIQPHEMGAGVREAVSISPRIEKDVRVPHFEPETRASKKKAAQKTIELTAYCIRCADPVVYNTDKPFCRSDYDKWARFENEDYEELYCHMCGVERKTSKRKPLCRSCYRDDIPF